MALLGRSRCVSLATAKAKVTMADELNTTLARWIRLQRITWQSDSGSKAVRVALEREGEKIHEFEMATPELAAVLHDAMQLQADELPTGAHQFRVVAYDEKGLQLSELPQTVRGRSKEATSAANEAITHARASAMNVSNAAAATQLLRTELEREFARNNDLTEDKALLIDKIQELVTQNFDAQLRLAEFNRKMERTDKLYDALTTIFVPLGTLVVEKYGPKLLAMQPSEILDKGKAVLAKLNEKDQPTEGEPNVPEPTAQPDSHPVPVVPEPEQGRVPQPVEGGAQGSDGNVSRERGATPSRATKPTKARRGK